MPVGQPTAAPSARDAKNLMKQEWTRIACRHRFLQDVMSAVRKGTVFFDDGIMEAHSYTERSWHNDRDPPRYRDCVRALTQAFAS